MGGFSSMDDLINQMTVNGKFKRADWCKLTGVVQTTTPLWHCLAHASGTPSVDPVLSSGTNLTFQPMVHSSTSTTATTAAAGGNFATSVFTDTTHATGRFTIGTLLTGAGVPANTYITSYGTGTGSNNGGTYNLSTTPGTLSSVTVTGTAYPAYLDDGADVGGGSPFKHIVNASAFTAGATSMPAVFMLVDILGFYPISTVTTTGAQTLTNGVAIPARDSGGATNGAAVQAFLMPSVVMGAGTPTVQLNYTNSAGTSGRLTPAFPELPTLNATAPVLSVPYSGVGAGKFGPFLPLQSGDSGIQSVQSINFSATMTSGIMNLVLCRPLLTLPMTTIGVAAERDLVNQLPSLPKVYDGSCLTWLMYNGAATPATTPFYGHIDFAWS